MNDEYEVKKKGEVSLGDLDFMFRFCIFNFLFLGIICCWSIYTMGVTWLNFFGMCLSIQFLGVAMNLLISKWSVKE